MTEYTVEKCTGRCCESFFLPFTQESLEEAYESTVNGVADKTFPDLMIWKPYLVHLEAANVVDTGAAGAFWMCTAFDPLTRKCTIYEARPSACREYPYMKRCIHCDDVRSDNSVRAPEPIAADPRNA